MLHLFLTKTIKYIDLDISDVLKQLFKIIEVENVVSLIDCGGLVVGTTNKQFAFQFLYHTKLFNAVTFFNNETNLWQIIDRTGDLWNLESSPVQVWETFVYFDEYRCRGADKKLVDDARALVTLGPNMSKDKLFQGIARLRSIGKSQSFIICGTVEVSKSIDQLLKRFDSENYNDGIIKSEHILNWATNNTIQSIKKGMTQWCSQGELFCHTENLPVNYSLQSE